MRLVKGTVLAGGELPLNAKFRAAAVASIHTARHGANGPQFGLQGQKWGGEERTEGYCSREAAP